MKRSIVVVAVLSLLSQVVLAVTKVPKGNEVFVFQDGGSRVNNFCPANWMGSFGDLKFNQMWKENPAEGKNSIQIKYTAERKQGDGWAGIYWAATCNDWGSKPFDYNLKGFKKIKFKARGEKGGEVIDKFYMGGICGEAVCDSGAGQTDTIELTKKWQDYEIDLSQEDLTSVVGGFGFSITADSNPKGATFYVDEVRYVQ